MKKVKISVLKTTFDKKLADKYGFDGLGKCPMLNLKDSAMRRSKMKNL